MSTWVTALGYRHIQKVNPPHYWEKRKAPRPVWLGALSVIRDTNNYIIVGTDGSEVGQQDRQV